MTRKKMGMDKTFLATSPDETGYLCWSTELNPAKGRFTLVSSELKMADCEKHIRLDFDCYKVKDIDKRIAKVDTLLASLAKLRESLVDCKETATRMGLK